MNPANGYVECVHVYCFAVFIGKPGECCPDCHEACGQHAVLTSCDGCDHDDNGPLCLIPPRRAYRRHYRAAAVPRQPIERHRSLDR